MNFKKEIRRILIVSLMIAALFCTSYAKACIVNNQDAFVSRGAVSCGGTFG